MGSGSGGSKSDSFTRKDVRAGVPDVVQHLNPSQLRDIFRIQPDTACGTHDLLDCKCGDVADEEASEDNTKTVIAALDGSESELDDEEVELVKTFQAASQLKPEQMERADKAVCALRLPIFRLELTLDPQYAKKKKAELAALSEWTHIHCLRESARDYVQDPVLRKLLHAPVSTANKPLARSTSLLEAVDIDNILAMDEDRPEVGARDVPGGTISFLFERSSTTALPSEDDDGSEEPTGDKDLGE
jgi:DNA repair and recombination protein RAD54B